MIRSPALSALALAALPSAAAAAPAFKAAPESEKSGEGGDWSAYLPIDTEGAPPWVQGALEFLAGNYGYIGVAAVLLMLFLFARGPGGGKEAQPGSGDDDDFFEPDDVGRYRGDSR